MDSRYYLKSSPEEQAEFRNWLRGILKTEEVKIEFTKKDGSIRTMLCTLNPALVKDYEKKTDRVKVVNEETCPVFDIEKQEWRSFRFDTLVSVKFSAVAK